MQKKEYRYQLDKGSKKFKCPDCGHKSLVLYIDQQTGDYLPDTCGRCDRENRCAYHLTPAKFKEENTQHWEAMQNKSGTSYAAEKWQSGQAFTPPAPPRKIDLVPFEWVTRSLEIKEPGKQDETDGLLQTDFAQHLGGQNGFFVTHYLLEKYCVGRSKIGNGTSCVFYRIDINNQCRTGKIMAYIRETGKRNKDIPPMWIHALKKDGKPIFPDFDYQLCFFGEHLINKEPEKPIGLLESEKSAIVANYYNTDFIWIATGGQYGCKWTDFDVFKVLKNRTVVLFPDFGYANKKSGKTCFERWCEAAETIRQAIPVKISVSRLLEDNLPESYREQDFDLADLFIATNGGRNMENLIR